jgi:hypothetical protein
MHHQRHEGYDAHHHRREAVDEKTNLQIDVADCHPAIDGAVVGRPIHHFQQRHERDDERNQHTCNRHGMRCRTSDLVSEELGSEQTCDCSACERCQRHSEKKVRVELPRHSGP